jgi:hypothetical protein
MILTVRKYQDKSSTSIKTTVYSTSVIKDTFQPLLKSDFPKQHGKADTTIVLSIVSNPVGH